MLRNAVIGIGVLCVVGGAIAVLGGVMPGLVAVFWGALLLVSTLYERVRYKTLVRDRPSGAVRTNERFVDEDTGRTITVYVEPSTGERSYVEE